MGDLQTGELRQRKPVVAGPTEDGMKSDERLDKHDGCVKFAVFLATLNQTCLIQI